MLLVFISADVVMASFTQRPYGQLCKIRLSVCGDSRDPIPAAHTEVQLNGQEGRVKTRLWAVIALVEVCSTC